MKARYRIHQYQDGVKRHVATVAAESADAARERVAKARQFEPGDLFASEVRARVEQICGRCAWTFKGTTRPASWGAPLCAVCAQDDVVTDRARDLVRAQRKLAQLKTRREAERARRVRA